MLLQIVFACRFKFAIWNSTRVLRDDDLMPGICMSRNIRTQREATVTSLALVRLDMGPAVSTV